MATPNPFDQFDALPTASEAPRAPVAANPFDQFDEMPAAPQAVNPFDQFDSSSPAANEVTSQGDASLWDTFTNSASRGWRGLQQLLPTLRATNRAAVLTQLEAIDRGEQLAPEQLGIFAEQYLAASPEQRERIKRAFGTDKLPGAMGEDIATVAQLQKEKEAFPAPASVQAIMNAPTFGESLGLIGEHPLDFLTSIGPESLIQSAPGLIAAIPAAAAGPAGPMATIGANSFMSEMASGVLGELAERGIDTTNPQAIQAALSDRALLDEITSKLTKRAGFVGGVDALSGGLASKTFLPAKVLAKRPIARKAAEMAIQTPLQGAIGAGGYAGGQIASGDEIKPGEFLAEGFGELVTTPAEVAVLQSQAIKNALKGQDTAVESTPEQIDAILRRKDETQHGARMEPAPSAESTNGKQTETAAPSPDTMPSPADTGSPPPGLGDVQGLAPIRQPDQESAITPPPPAPAIQPRSTAEPAPTDALPPGDPAPAAAPSPPKTEVPSAQPAPPVSTPAPTPPVEPVTQPGEVQAGGTTAPEKPAPSTGWVTWRPHDKDERPSPPPKATTGKPFTAPVYRGSGKTAEQIYAGAQVPVAGEGGYYAFNATDAENYGETIQQGEATLNNPLVIKNDDQWRALTKDRAGWRFPNPSGQSDETLREWTAALRDAVTKDGHDGIVIQMDTRGDYAKTMRDVFGHDQIIDYRPPPYTPAAAPASQTPVSKPETAPAPVPGNDLATLTQAIGDEKKAKQFLKLSNNATPKAEAQAATLKSKLTPEQQAAVTQWEQSRAEAAKQIKPRPSAATAPIQLPTKEAPAKEEMTTLEVNASTPAAADDAQQEDGPLELRRPVNKPIKSERGSLSTTREGEMTSSRHDEILQAAGMTTETMMGLPADEQFKRLSQIVKDTFGFTSIRKDATLNWIEANDVMKDAYVGMINHCAVMQINPAMMSLNGTLNLELKVSLGEGTLAHYDPRTKTIAMVRRNDSFAHEYAHAVDHWLLQHFAPELNKGRGQLLTGKIRSGGEPKTLNDEVRNALINTLNALFFDTAKAALHVQELEFQIGRANTPKKKAALQKQLDTFRKGHSKKMSLSSDYYTRARTFDGDPFEPGGDDAYWQKPTEMFARAYEAWVANKLDLLGADGPFVTKNNRQYNQDRVGQFYSVYPKASDREAIFGTLDVLMETMREHGLAGTGDAPGAFLPMELKYLPKHSPHITPEQTKQIRGVVGRVLDQLREAKAEMYEAQREGRERKKLDKRIRQMQLNAADAEGLRRMLHHIGLSISDAYNDITAGHTSSITSIMLSLNERYEGHPGLSQALKWFTHNPGAGGLQGKTYNKTVGIEDRRWHSKFSDIIQAHRLRKWDKAKLRLLRDVLVHAKPFDSAPADVRAAATELRKFLDDLYYYNTQNGVEMGYTKEGFLPRLIDALIVENDVDGWRKQARHLYAGKVYDETIGSTNDLMVNTALLDSLLKHVSEIANTGRTPEAKAAAAKQLPLAKEIEKLRAKIEAQSELKTDKAKQTVKEATAELKKKVDLLREMMRMPWSYEAANDWELRVRAIGGTMDHKFESRGPASDYTKARVLPAETDAIMGDYMITDPLTLISQYISMSARRVTFGKFFGNEEKGRAVGWKLDDMLNSLTEPYTAADGSTQRIAKDDMEELMKSIDLMTGRYNSNVTHRGLRRREKLTAFVIPGILGRAIYSQLAEPATVGTKDKNLMHMLSVYHSQLQDLLSVLPIKTIREKAAFRREMAEALGVVTDHLSDQLLQSRYNLLNHSADSRLTMSRFFVASAIHPHNMSMRRGAVQVFLKRWGPKMAKLALQDTPEGKVARGDLQSYGIDTSNAELMKEFASLGEITNAKQLEKLRHLDEIRSAINRYVDLRIASPSIEDKPSNASTPERSYMYALTSFNFVFQRNVLQASAKEIVRAFRDGNLKVGAQTTAGLAIGLSALFGLQVGAWILRSLAWGEDDWEDIEEKLADDWFLIGASRSGFTGAADPLLNAWTGVKYDRDLSAIMAGAVVNQPLDAAQKIGEAVMDSKSPHAVHEATEAVWKAGIGPYAVSKALQYAGRNPWVDAGIGIGAQAITSSRVSAPVGETVAEAVTNKPYVTKAEKKAAAATPTGKIKAIESAQNKKSREQTKATKNRLEEIKRRNQ